MERRGARIAGGALALLWVPLTTSPAKAHDEDPKADASSLDAGPDADKRNDVTEVRVRGTTPPRSASETTRGRDVLRAAPHRTGSDALLAVPGVFVTQHSGEGKAHQIFLRGFDAIHGQDVEIWVGGVPVNEVSNIHGQGYADLHFVMPEVVREIRSSPGTYDPRQGDFAVAGSLRMDLGYEEHGITGKVTAGSFGTKRAFLAFHPKGARGDTFAAFEAYETDGFGPARAAQRTSLLAQAVQPLGPGLEGRIFLGAYAGRFDSPGVLRRRDVEEGRIDRFASYDPNQGGSSARTQLLAELRKDEGPERWSLAPFVILRSMGLRQNFTGYLQDPTNGDNTRQANDSATVGATASYRRRVEIFSPRDAFEAGALGRHDRIEQSQQPAVAGTTREVGGSALAGGPVDGSVRATDVAGYIDGDLHPLTRLALRGGVRIDGLAYGVQDKTASTASGPVRSAQGVHVGKKAAVDVTVAAPLHLVASYGEGFRSPQARSLQDGQRTPFTEVTSYEVGLRYAQDGLRGSLAAFRTDLSRDLAFDHVTGRNEVTPPTERTGLALELLAKPTAWFLTSASATYTRAVFAAGDARYGKGDLLPYVPQLVARTDASAFTTLGHVFGKAIEGRMGSALSLLHGRPLPFSEMGRDIFFLDATASIGTPEVTVSLDVYNVLNARYFDSEFVYASNFNRGAAPELVPLRHVTVGPPRAAYASVTLHL